MDYSLLDLPVQLLRNIVEHLPLVGAAHLRATSRFFNQLVIEVCPHLSHFLQFRTSKPALIHVLWNDIADFHFRSHWNNELKDELHLELGPGSPYKTVNSTPLEKSLYRKLTPKEEETIAVRNGLLFSKNTGMPYAWYYNVTKQRSKAESINVQDVFELLMELFYDLSFLCIRCDVFAAKGDVVARIERALRRNNVRAKELDFTIKVPNADSMVLTLPWTEMMNLKHFKIFNWSRKPTVHLNLTDADLFNWDFDELDFRALTKVTSRGLHQLLEQFLTCQRRRSIELVLDDPHPVSEIVAGLDPNDVHDDFLDFNRNDMTVRVHFSPSSYNREWTKIKIHSFKQSMDDDND